MQVVKDNESSGWFSCLQLSKVNRLSGESGHGSTFVQVCSALWQVFVELDFLWLLTLQVVPSASELEYILLWRWSFNIANLDWQVK
jgi:hypothetical protein